MSDIPITYTTPALEELKRQRVFVGAVMPSTVRDAVRTILDYLIAQEEARLKR